MRVGVDARHLGGNRGVAHYTSAILTALASEFPDDEWRLLVRAGEAGGPFGIPRADNLILRRPALPGRLPYATGAALGRPRLDRLLGGGLDVLWAPAPAPLARSARLPFVLTVHDLSFVARPGDFTVYERLWHRLARPRALAHGAQRIITVSRTVAEDVSARWQVDPARVRVVMPGVTRAGRDGGAAAVAQMRGRLGLPERYLLAVGALEPRKAPDVLLAAHAVARSEGLDADLVFAGAGRLGRRLRGPGVHRLGVVDGTDLDALYAGALALIMPSRLEGFGLPPLEAALRGTPAVVSELPVFHETMGDAVLRFPVDDVRALSQALLRVASDEGLRHRLATAAARAVAPLTWAAAARGVRRALSEVAG